MIRARRMGGHGYDTALTPAGVRVTIRVKGV